MAPKKVGIGAFPKKKRPVTLPAKVGGKKPPMKKRPIRSGTVKSTLPARVGGKKPPMKKRRLTRPGRKR